MVFFGRLSILGQQHTLRTHTTTLATQTALDTGIISFVDVRQMRPGEQFPRRWLSSSVRPLVRTHVPGWPLVSIYD